VQGEHPEEQESAWACWAPRKCWDRDANREAIQADAWAEQGCGGWVAAGISLWVG